MQIGEANAKVVVALLAAAEHSDRGPRPRRQQRPPRRVELRQRQAHDFDRRRTSQGAVSGKAWPIAR